MTNSLVVVFMFFFVSFWIFVSRVETKTSYDCGKVLLLTSTFTKEGTPEFYRSTQSKTAEVSANTYVQYKVGDNFCWAEPVATKDKWYYLSAFCLIGVLLIILIFLAHL
jgi:hypothetical protein